METVYIVLIVLLVIYIPLYIYVRKSKKMHDKGIVPYGPTIMIKTSWGLKLMDRLAKYKRFWNVMGIISMGVALLLAIGIVTILIIDLTVLPQMFGRSGIGIEYALAIPGLNPVLPVVYGIIGLVVAMVFHELAHGIQSRANDITVNSSGILYGVVPLGAFVEPDEEETEKASRKARMHVYAAGITTNTFLALLAFAIMVFSMTTCMTSDYGNHAAVYSLVKDTEAYSLDIETSSIVMSIDGDPVDIDSFEDKLRANQSSELKTYQVEFNYKGEKRIQTMPLGACVSSISSDSPASTIEKLKVGTFITKLAVNAIEGAVKYINTPKDFTDFMSETKPDWSISVTYCICHFDKDSKVYVMEYDTKEVVLDSNGDKGFFGISTTISGMAFTTPNAILKTGIDPFYGREGIQAKAMGMLAYISQPFQGFSPVPESVTWWYHSDTFISDEVFWILMWTIYWIFWLNIVLGISNALPALPFDGGLLLIGATDWLLEKTGMKDKEQREKRVGRITSVISNTMLFVMILVVVAIII